MIDASRKPFCNPVPADTKCSILHLIPDMDMAYYTLIGRLTEMESKECLKEWWLLPLN